MVATVWVRIQVQTRGGSAPALLTVAEYPLDERLTNSLGCPPNMRNSQVIRRIRHRGQRGGAPASRVRRCFDRGCWAVAPQPAGNAVAFGGVLCCQVGNTPSKRAGGAPNGLRTYPWGDVWGRRCEGKRCRPHFSRCLVTPRRVQLLVRRRRRVCAAATVEAVSATATVTAMATGRKPSALSNNIHNPNIRKSRLAKTCSNFWGRR